MFGRSSNVKGQQSRSGGSGVGVPSGFGTGAGSGGVPWSASGGGMGIIGGTDVGSRGVSGFPGGVFPSGPETRMMDRGGRDGGREAILSSGGDERVRVNVHALIQAHPFFSRLHRDDIVALQRVLDQHQPADDVPWAMHRHAVQRRLPQVAQPIFRAIEAVLDWRQEVNTILADWETRYKAGLEVFALVSSEAERRKVFTNIAAQFSPPGSKPPKIAAREQRFFKPDANLLTETYTLRRTRMENTVRCAHMVGFELVSELIKLVRADAHTMIDICTYWFEYRGLPNAIYPITPRFLLWGVSASALELIEACARAVRILDSTYLFPARLIRRLTRECQDPEPSMLWVQVAAIKCLRVLEPEVGAEIYRRRMLNLDLSPSVVAVLQRSRPAIDDDPGPVKPASDKVFIRQNLVESVYGYLSREQARRALIDIIEGQEPSEYVRVTACKVASTDPTTELLAALNKLAEHPSRVTRAKAMQAMLRAGVQLNPRGEFWRDLEIALLAENDVPVIRHICEDILDAVKNFQECAPKALALLTHLRARDPLPGAALTYVARAHNLVTLWCLHWYRNYRAPLAGMILEMGIGEKRTINKGLWPYGLEELCRFLTTLSDKNHGFEVKETRSGFVLYWGDRVRVMPWRLWHETVHPAPDKRVAYAHHQGRAPVWRHRVPPALLAELSPTKVPGERVFVEAAESWCPFAPLPEDYLSLLHWNRSQKQPVTIHSHFGRTVITPPRSLFQRLRGYVKFSRRFAKEAQRRLDMLRTDPYEKGPKRWFDHIAKEYGIRTEWIPWDEEVLPDEAFSEEFLEARERALKSGASAARESGYAKVTDQSDPAVGSETGLHEPTRAGSTGGLDPQRFAELLKVAAETGGHEAVPGRGSDRDARPRNEFDSPMPTPETFVPGALDANRAPSPDGTFVPGAASAMSPSADTFIPGADSARSPSADTFIPGADSARSPAADTFIPGAERAPAESSRSSGDTGHRSTVSRTRYESSGDLLREPLPVDGPAPHSAILPQLRAPVNPPEVGGETSIIIGALSGKVLKKLSNPDLLREAEAPALSDKAGDASNAPPPPAIEPPNEIVANVLAARARSPQHDDEVVGELSGTIGPTPAEKTVVAGAHDAGRPGADAAVGSAASNCDDEIVGELSGMIGPPVSEQQPASDTPSPESSTPASTDAPGIGDGLLVGEMSQIVGSFDAESSASPPSEAPSTAAPEDASSDSTEAAAASPSKPIAEEDPFDVVVDAAEPRHADTTLGDNTETDAPATPAPLATDGSDTVVGDDTEIGEPPVQVIVDAGIENDAYDTALGYRTEHDLPPVAVLVEAGSAGGTDDTVVTDKTEIDAQAPEVEESGADCAVNEDGEDGEDGEDDGAGNDNEGGEPNTNKNGEGAGNTAQPDAQPDAPAAEPAADAPTTLLRDDGLMVGEISQIVGSIDDRREPADGASDDAGEPTQQEGD